jgi:hypothetical protein
MKNFGDRLLSLAPLFAILAFGGASLAQAGALSGSTAANAFVERLAQIRVAPAGTADALTRAEVLALEDELIETAFADARAARTGIDSRPSDALHRIITQVDGEHWTQFENHRYSLIKSIFRSQGVTTDDNGHWWFSCYQAILRTYYKWGAERVLHLFPIPSALSKLGDNHIGDIDQYDGKIYTGLEDGPKYLHPHVGLYDAWNLKFEKDFSLPVAWQPDGVPWVAVDPLNHHAISSQYNNTTKINVYDLDTLAPVEQIPMSHMVNAIQGAKVHHGALYMSANAPDNKNFQIYKMVLATGTVITVGDLPSPRAEVEGLTFSSNEKETSLYVLDVVAEKPFPKINRRTELVGYKMDQPSRRELFLQEIGVRD